MTDFLHEDEIKKLDPQNTFETTELLTKQCEAAWQQVTALDLPKHIEGITNIVFCGMGASIYGALVLKAILGRNMPYPTEMVTDYYLPDYVGPQTLVVLTSYSGTTEEVLSCAEDAKAKGAQMIVLTKGSQLAEFAQDNNIPAYIFDGKLNLSGTPRFGAGYTIFGLIGLLNKINIIDIEEQVITDALIQFTEKYDELKKQAMTDYQLFYQKVPIIFAAEHLSGNAQILRNQFNEVSKSFAADFLIPDLNHHLLEGFQFPKDAPLHFIVLNSPNYSEKIKKRMELTTQIVQQHHYPVYEFMTSGQSVYADFLEVLQHGSFLTLFLSLAYKQNPAGNPLVDWFKEKLNEK